MRPPGVKLFAPPLVLLRGLGRGGIELLQILRGAGLEALLALVTAQPHQPVGLAVLLVDILHDLPDVVEIYVPIGGGGLAAGVLIAVKAKNPKVKVIGVQSSGFPAMKKSFDAGKLQSVSGHRTIADGISVKTPGQSTFKIINELIDDIVLVDDSAIVKAMFLLMERAKMVVEPAGAVGLAYLLDKKPSKGKKVVPILSGGNVDMYLLGQIVAKGLTEMGRMVKIFILLTDKPGALKEVVDQISSLSVNIVDVTTITARLSTLEDLVCHQLASQLEGVLEENKLIKARLAVLEQQNNG